MMNGSHGGMCVVCKTLTVIVGIIGLLLAIAALIGVYTDLFSTAGATYGSTASSFAIIAAVASLMLMKKGMKACSCRGGCACGMANCNCGDKKMDGKKM